MGKLGKKARKFAKKNLQSVLKRQRKMKSMFKKKARPRHGDAAGESDKVMPQEHIEGSAEMLTKDAAASNTHLDNMFSEDEDSFTEDISDSDGFLSEDSECPYILEEDKKGDSEDKNGHSDLVRQNSEIHIEIVKQKRKLNRLLDKDHKFSEFLQKLRAHVEQFRSEDTYSDGEDDRDYPNGDATSENLNSKYDQKILTSCTIDVWCWLVLEEPNGSALSNLLNGFRTACQYGIDSVECPQRIPDKEVFSKISTFVLCEADGIFRRKLGIADSCSVESFIKLESTSWKTVRPLMKSYLWSCLFLLNQVTDCQLLVFILSRLRASILFFAAFPSLIGRLIKITVHLWVTGDESLSLSSFATLRVIASQLNSDCLEHCLSKVYKAFIAHCKFIQPTNMKHLEFLKNSIVELYSLDIEKCFQKVLMSLQYLANILRRALRTKKKEELKKIYSWQYVNCVHIWVRFITHNIKHHDLQSLTCTLIQVIRGMAHLFPGPRYLPLRFKCVEMLNQLSLASGTFIPVTSLVFDCLEYTGIDKDNSTHRNAFNFASNLKVPKQLLRARGFHEECIHFAVELLAGHFSQWSYHISFPEVATIPLILLKRFHERTTYENLKRPVKRLIDQIEQNCQFIQRKRDEVAFSPNDEESIKSFLQLEKCGSTSFSQYYASILQKSQIDQRRI